MLDGTLSNRMTVLGYTLKNLEDDEGRITPEKVVDAAKDPESVLHSEFEWDDAKAGYAYRLSQARQLLKDYRIWIEVKRGETSETVIRVKVPAYVRDPSAKPKEQGYRNINVISKEEDSARSAVVNEVNAASAHVRRAISISTALAVTPQLVEVALKLDAIKAELR